jgi:hypothetical protein
MSISLGIIGFSLLMYLKNYDFNLTIIYIIWAGLLIPFIYFFEKERRCDIPN